MYEIFSSKEQATVYQANPADNMARLKKRVKLIKMIKSKRDQKLPKEKAKI